MDMIKVSAIWRKQWKDSMKNKSVLIQFVIFPVLAFIMEKAVKVEGMPHNYFVLLFATMFIGIAPLSSMAAILAEEKEKNTLRVLLQSNVKAPEYLLGTGGCVWAVCMLGSLLFAFAGSYKGRELAAFLLIMCAGVIISVLIGAVVGTFAVSQAAATGITVPVMMIFAFLPMLGMFNDTIARISRFTYSQQINNLMAGVGTGEISGESMLILAVNLLVVLALFTAAYRRNRLAVV